MAVLQLQPRQAVAEADVTAKLRQLLPQVYQNIAEVVGAHMGLGIAEDALRRAVGGQGFQYEAVAHVSGAGIQLAVGKRARAALAELDVGLRVQRPGLPEPLHVLCPPLHVPAPFQQDGARAAPGQGQGAEQASGSRAYHDRWDLRRIDGVRQTVRRLADRRDIFIFTAF